MCWPCLYHFAADEGALLLPLATLLFFHIVITGALSSLGKIKLFFSSHYSTLSDGAFSFFIVNLSDVADEDMRINRRRLVI